MKTLRALIVKLLVWMAQILSPRSIHILAISEQSLRVWNDLDQIDDRIKVLETRRANWDHTFDHMGVLTTRVTSLERTSNHTQAAAAYIRDFRQRLEAMAQGSTPILRDTLRAATVIKTEQEEISPVREMNQFSEVTADRNFTT